MTLLLAGVLGTAAAQAIPAGQSIDPAAYADLTPEGLDVVAGLIPGLLPTQVAIPTTSGGSDNGFCLIDYSYELSDAWAGIQVLDTQIVPGAGVLDVTAELLVNVNNSGDPFSLSYELACIGDNCPGYVDPFTVTLHTTLGLEVVEGSDGQNHIAAEMGDVDLDYALDNADIHLDCFIGDLETVLNALGLSLYDLLLTQIDAIIRAQVDTLGPALEDMIESAFSAATIDQALDLNGVSAHLRLAPSAVEVNPAGVRIQLAGSVVGDGAADCVSAFDPLGSAATKSDPPAIGSAPSGIPTPYHLGIGLGDDFANQTLYTLWRVGPLCYQLCPDGAIPLDTGLLALLTDNVYTDLFPEAEPVTLRTVPRTPPTASFDGTEDVNARIENLDLEFFAQLDGRAARVLVVTVSGPVGANQHFDAATGALSLDVVVDPGEFTYVVGANEFAPGTEATILASFEPTFGSLLGTMLGTYLGESLSFSLPSLSGIGVESLTTAATGADADWLGAYTELGAVTYGDGTGCGGCSGSGSGCGGGCGLATPRPVGLAGLLLGMVLLRRRPD